MEGLEQQIQSILSDPAQMQSILSLASSLGLGGSASPAAEQPAPPQPGSDLSALTAQLASMQGGEIRALEALRSAVSAKGQRSIDRAQTAARLSRLAAGFLKNRGASHV